MERIVRKAIEIGTAPNPAPNEIQHNFVRGRHSKKWKVSFTGDGEFLRVGPFHFRIMGNLKKKRRLKMSQHKRRKRLKSNRHKKRTW